MVIRSTSSWLIFAVASSTGLLGVAGGDDAAVFAPMSASEAQRQVQVWLSEQPDVDESLRSAIDHQWQSLDPETSSVADRLDAVMRSFYLADPATREFVDACLSQGDPTVLRELPILSSLGRSLFHSHNIRYFYARYLAILTLYDESLEVFRQVDPKHVVDPAGCLFYRAVCEHALLQQEEGLATLESLLSQTEGVPVRYRSVGELMRQDLEALEEKSLGEVARQMRDVQRRLQLGSSGPGVQRVEERIIATLDEIIKKLEQQQQGGGGSSGGQGRSQGNQSSGPAEDSYIGGQEAPGDVDRKELEGRSKWGELPPKAQEKARNMINRQFPAHYRQAVEQYLKKLAERRAPAP